MTPVWAAKLARLCEALVRDKREAVTVGGGACVGVDPVRLAEIEQVLKNRKTGHGARKET